MKDFIDQDTYYKYEKETSKLRMAGGAWSVKPEKIKSPIITKIIYLTENKEYSITKNDLLKHGFNLTFQGESKIVIPLKWWKIQQAETLVNG